MFTPPGHAGAMGEGTKLILGMAGAALLGVVGLLFFAVDTYIPSAALEAAVQGARADQAEDRLYDLLRGCKSRRAGRSHSYARGSIGTYNRSFPAIRNDKGWLGGTKVRCDGAGCTVTSTAMIASPRESASCRTWERIPRE